MISSPTFAHWLSVMDTPDGADEATETRNAWYVISKDFSTGTPNNLLAALKHTPMAAILIPDMRDCSIELYLAHHICRLTPSSVPVTDLCEFFASLAWTQLPC
jgi:hypothetical protein